MAVPMKRDAPIRLFRSLPILLQRTMSRMIARRAGTTAALAQINKYFLWGHMPVISSRYWNMVHGSTPEQVRADSEGMRNLRMLAKNMAWFLKCKEAGEKIAPGMKIVNLEKGNTAVAAEYIKKAVGGDLFEIETVKTYIKDHMKMIYEAKEELEAGTRVEVKGYPDNFDEYGTVYLGFSNWLAYHNLMQCT